MSEGIQSATEQAKPNSRSKGLSPRGSRDGRGTPLSTTTLPAMERAFGHDFSTVRVHTDDRAAEAARGIRARAFTVGSDIYFARAAYDPHTADGRRLLAHELTHVVQQSDPAAAGTEWRPESAAEREADSAASRVSTGGSTRVLHRHGRLAQRKEDNGTAVNDSLGVIGDATIDLIAGQAVKTVVLQRMTAAAMRGFFAEMARQIVDEKGAERAKRRLRELLHPVAVVRLIGGYVSGLIAGLVSPVTDLVGLTAIADVIPKLALKGITKLAHLAGEADEIGAELRKIGSLARDAVVALIENKRDLVELISAAQDTAVQQSGALGRGAAKSVVGIFEAPFEADKAESDPGWGSVLPTASDALSSPGLATLGTFGRALDYGSGRLKKALITTPWAKVGYQIGHVVGVVAINIAMLLLSGGIGNVITKLSGAFGRLAPALRMLATAGARVGEAIAVVEELIGAVVGGILKRLKPLKAVAGAFEGLLLRLQILLNRILGIVEKEGGQVGATAIKKGAGSLPARSRAYTAEGTGEDFTHGPYNEVRENITVERAKLPLQSEAERLEYYADVTRPQPPTKVVGPANSAAGTAESGPYIRENLYIGDKSRNAVRNLERAGVLRRNRDTLEVLNPARYVDWLERSYFHHGDAHLDPRMKKAIHDYVAGGVPLATTGSIANTGGSSFAGSLPGTHAEIQALNDVLIAGEKGAIRVATLRAETGAHFPACLHCRGVIERLAEEIPELQILTGAAGR